MSPSVMPRLQVRRATAPVRRQRRRHLLDVEIGPLGPKDHLARKFHPGRLKIEGANGIGAKAAKPAMEIADLDIKEQSAEKAQDGITEIAVQEGHRSRRDPATEAVAHHEI